MIKTGLSILLITLLHGARGDIKGYEKDVPLKATGMIQVLDFDPKNKLVQVISVKLPGEGDSWVKVSELLKSIDLDKTKQARQWGQLSLLKPGAKCMKLKLVKNVDTYLKDEELKSNIDPNSPPPPLNPCDKKS